MPNLTFERYELAFSQQKEEYFEVFASGRSTVTMIRYQRDTQGRDNFQVVNDVFMLDEELLPTL